MRNAAGIPDSTRGLSVEEIQLYAHSVIQGWEDHWKTVLSPLSPDMLRVIAGWCLTLAEQREPAPELGAPTYGWQKIKMITRVEAHLPAASLIRLMDERGMSVPEIADELARLQMGRADGRITWEQRAISRLLLRERGRRHAWDVPRVDGGVS